jgi:AcrR family transcriptional regulator
MNGLRERKKQQTRDAIQREGLRLIAEQGYDATTCEQIAAAAGVSPATLFRYFATKEDVVLHDVYDPMIAQAVRARPAGEAPMTAVRNAFADALAQVYEADLEPIRQRTALVLSVPALRARSHEQRASLVAHLAHALAERTGTAVDDLDVEIAASLAATVVSVAVARWARHGGSLPQHVSDAFDSATAVVGGPR